MYTTYMETKKLVYPTSRSLSHRPSTNRLSILPGPNGDAGDRIEWEHGQCKCRLTREKIRKSSGQSDWNRYAREVLALTRSRSQVSPGLSCV